MSSADVHIPSLLRPSTGGRATIRVSGTSLAAAIDDLFGRYPTLRIHVQEADGTQRQHVLVFFNGENTARLDLDATPVRDGDQIVIVQAVSGG